jgi:hypothetical protein
VAAGGGRPESGDLVERELGAGGDREIVVADALAVDELDPVLRRMHALRADRHEVDLLLRERARDVELDVGALAPVDGDPRIARHEMEARRVRDHRDPILTPRQLTHLVGHRHPAEARAQNDDVRHDSSGEGRRDGGARSNTKRETAAGAAPEKPNAY